DLLTQPRHLLPGRPRGDAQVYDVDLALVAAELLEQRQRQDDGSVFDHGAAIDDPHYFEFLGFELEGIADFFRQYFSGSLAQDDGALSGVVRQAPGDDL